MNAIRGVARIAAMLTIAVAGAVAVAESHKEMAKAEGEMLEARTIRLTAEAKGIALEALRLVARASQGCGNEGEAERLRLRIERFQRDCGKGAVAQ